LVSKPYGDLVGVRPGKLADSMLNYGFSPKEIVHRLELERGMARDKAQLLVEVSFLQRELLVHTRGRTDLISLYINIPFCPSRCAYCSFASHSLTQYRESHRADYVHGLHQELASLAALMKTHSLKLCTVYIGGGTPTTLTAAQLNEILETVHALPAWEQGLEVTLEAGRPETIDRDKLCVVPLKTRLSINPQSMHDKTLTRIGRNHSVQQIRDSFALAQSMGFANINADLIIGLPDEDASLVQQSLAEVLELKPASVTLHMFSPKRASRYGAGEQWVPLGVDEAVKAGQWAFIELRQAGMRPYYLYRQRGILAGQENTGWSLPGRECIYNVLVISETQVIFGVGAGASSIFPHQQGEWDRHQNPKDAKVHLNRLSESIEEKQALLEKWRSKV